MRKNMTNKEIEATVEIMTNYCNKFTGDCAKLKMECTDCYAQTLYEAGYRKLTEEK